MKYQYRRLSFLADLAHLAVDLAGWLWLHHWRWVLLGMALGALEGGGTRNDYLLPPRG